MQVSKLCLFTTTLITYSHCNGMSEALCAVGKGVVVGAAAVAITSSTARNCCVDGCNRLDECLGVDGSRAELLRRVNALEDELRISLTEGESELLRLEEAIILQRQIAKNKYKTE